MLRILQIGLVSGMVFGIGFLSLEMIVNLFLGYSVELDTICVFTLLYIVIFSGVGIISGIVTPCLSKLTQTKLDKTTQYIWCLSGILIITITFITRIAIPSLVDNKILFIFKSKFFIISILLLLSAGLTLYQFISKRYANQKNKFLAINYSIIVSLTILLIVRMRMDKIILKANFPFISLIILNGIMIIGSAGLGILLYQIIFRLLEKNVKLSWKLIIPSFLIIFLIPYIYSYITFQTGKSKETKDIVSNQIKEEDFPNIILINIDTLRADHLECYGYKRITGPNMAKIAREGVLFKNAIDQSNWTVPSVVSLLTSLYPSTHRVSNIINGKKSWGKLHKSVITLAQVLRKKGYTTAGVVANPLLEEEIGFSRGFDFYTILTQENIYSYLYVHSEYLLGRVMRNCMPNPYDKILADGKTLNKNIFPWLEKYKDDTFFLFLQPMDPHDPYNPPESYEKMYSNNYTGKRYTVKDLTKLLEDIPKEGLQNLIDRYDGEIKFLDEQIGKLMDKLKEMNLLNNTLLIITADHGEAFLDHEKEVTHAHSLFECEIHVPLIIKYPDLIKEPVVIDQQVACIDIMPTILEILGIPIPEQCQGKSFLPLILQDNKTHKEFIFSERVDGYACVRTNNHKYIFVEKSREDDLGTPGLVHKDLKSLYDLKDDPKELHNIYNQNPKIVKILEENLITHLKDKGSIQQPETLGVEESKELQEQMKALGYIQ